MKDKNLWLLIILASWTILGEFIMLPYSIGGGKKCTINLACGPVGWIVELSEIGDQLAKDEKK